jgi:hypothetical protein
MKIPESQKYYTLKFKIPKYYARITSESNNKFDLDSISLSFPFSINASFKFRDEIIDIAKESVITLIDRRILNSQECCGSCIQESLNSLKEIKSDLVNIKKRLRNHINSPLFYFIDYIMVSINSFFDFMERNNLIVNREQYEKQIYFDALEIIRNHIAKCLYEIAIIGKISIGNNHYAFKDGEIGWQENNYYEDKKIIDIKI